jgi:hypothetical protein
MRIMSARAPGPQFSMHADDWNVVRIYSMQEMKS